MAVILPCRVASAYRAAPARRRRHAGRAAPRRPRAPRPVRLPAVTSSPSRPRAARAPRAARGPHRRDRTTPAPLLSPAPRRAPADVEPGSAAARAWSAGAAPRPSRDQRRRPVRRGPGSGGATVAARAVVRDEVALPGTGPVALRLVLVRRELAGRGRASSCPRSWSAAAAAGGGSPRSASARDLPAPASTATQPQARARPRGSLRRRRPDRRGVGRRRSPTAVDGSPPASWTRSCWPATSSPRRGRRIDARWPLQRLAERYPTCWIFARRRAGRRDPGAARAGCERGLVTSRVLAGTIRRTGDDEHDLALAGVAGPLVARTSRSTSTPCARSPTRSRRTARR